MSAKHRLDWAELQLSHFDQQLQALREQVEVKPLETKTPSRIRVLLSEYDPVELTIDEFELHDDGELVLKVEGRAAAVFAKGAWSGFVSLGQSEPEQQENAEQPGLSEAEQEADYQAAKARRDLEFNSARPTHVDGEGDWRLTPGEHVGDD
ncbi:hypothetical protein M2390_003238 [Mycetocola sp. BIGb0189]|uniref:hypothetical protein n=1 Tax=Mycetocola sp. BIGb0189 TaxID=2940604 RepID=UPI002169DA7D|nr:hypothetical protein [Mycetocola sp. BIGb0189]MCS4278018.1 hypothetical protein [Mycetocola sp. BIGb0189]